MPAIGIIGGTGLDRLERLERTGTAVCTTVYGAASAPLTHGRFGGLEVVFLPRHGPDHRLPPHRVNYRANIAALAAAGVTEIVATTAVGGIAAEAAPGALVIPDQIIDYTWGREHTLHDGTSGALDHIDFSEPYTPYLRADLIAAARRTGIDVVPRGVYAATQGPRLETPAEIRRLAHDGCTIVGMTGMPEAALARETGLAYATVSLVVNWAAGLAHGPITTASIERHLATGMGRLLDVLGEFLSGRA